MTGPLPWMLVLQWALLIILVGLVASMLIVLAQRRRPTRVHILTHDKSQSWDDVKTQIEDRSQGPVQWRYTEVAKERLGS